MHVSLSFSLSLFSSLFISFQLSSFFFFFFYGRLRGIVTVQSIDFNKSSTTIITMSKSVFPADTHISFYVFFLFLNTENKENKDPLTLSVFLVDRLEEKALQY